MQEPQSGIIELTQKKCTFQSARALEPEIKQDKLQSRATQRELGMFIVF